MNKLRRDAIKNPVFKKSNLTQYYFLSNSFSLQLYNKIIAEGEHMRSSQIIYEDIKESLLSIKSHGGHIDQYDEKLFGLFIEAYKNHYMNFQCSPRLTGQAIVDRLLLEEDYTTTRSSTKYNLENRFNEKWSLWIEAFDKGFSNQYISWFSETSGDEPNISPNDKRFVDINYFELPKDTDMLLARESDLPKFIKYWCEYIEETSKEYPSNRYQNSRIHVKHIRNTYLELSLFIWSKDRFHEMKFSLPKHVFIQCVAPKEYKHPCIFVKDSWLNNFLKLYYSCYGLIDEVDFKERYKSDPAINPNSLRTE